MKDRFSRYGNYAEEIRKYEARLVQAAIERGKLLTEPVRRPDGTPILAE